MSMSMADLYPAPSVDALKKHFVGKNIYTDVPCPAAILNKGIIKRNCDLLISWTQRLGLHFRAHVKTHKTTELTRLQVGSLGNVNIVCSTVSEILHHVPFLRECKEHSRNVSVIYGIPPSSTCFARLEPARKELGYESVAFLLDHPAQLQHIASNDPTSRTPIWIKVDSGYHRAGVMPHGSELEVLLQAIAKTPGVQLQGFYGHDSQSYSVDSRAEALQYLATELTEAKKAVDRARALGLESSSGRFTISVGDSPSTTSVYRLSEQDESDDTRAFTELLSSIKQVADIELHAGVYPVLDVQQLATHASTRDTGVAAVNTSRLGMRVLVEVLSIYTERGKKEVLISAGTLALGREPCKAYDGWALLAPTSWAASKSIHEMLKGWTVARVSQEHGILVWPDENGEEAKGQELSVGQKMTVYPNHACVAGAGFDWYLVVDGDEGQVVEDVWVRCRGW